jgi:hypothetical protein
MLNLRLVRTVPDEKNVIYNPERTWVARSMRQGTKDDIDLVLAVRNRTRTLMFQVSYDNDIISAS